MQMRFGQSLQKDVQSFDKEILGKLENSLEFL